MIGPINAPMIATSTGSTYVTVTVTVLESVLVATSMGSVTERVAARTAAAPGLEDTAAARAPSPRREFDGELVAHRHTDQHETERHHGDDRQGQGELDRRLAVVRAE